MTRRAVLICPGRGSYNKPELGYITHHHGAPTDLAVFDAQRLAAGQPSVTALDSADRFTVASYSRGDIASPLIYASSLFDSRALAPGIELIAVTGNSMGWYIALAAAGVLDTQHGFLLVNTMGALMQEHLTGGQLIYPFIGPDWQNDPTAKVALLTSVATINARVDHTLALSIDLGGMLVLAGNEPGLTAFEAEHPIAQQRFPMRLHNHAAFHTSLQSPVAAAGRARIPANYFTPPDLPLIDGRGAIWWPHASDPAALYDYTLGHQVTEPYDFTRAIQTAAREFAPDLFIITGPGDTLGGAVAQSLILGNWLGMSRKSDFQNRQNDLPLLISMGHPDQRALVI